MTINVYLDGEGFGFPESSCHVVLFITSILERLYFREVQMSLCPCHDINTKQMPRYTVIIINCSLPFRDGI